MNTAYVHRHPRQPPNNHRALAPNASRSPVTRLPDEPLEHVFTHLDNKDDVANAALVCRQWTTPARRALFGSVFIQTYDDLDEIQDLWFGKNSTVQPQHVKRVHVLFTDDNESRENSEFAYGGGQPHPHVTNADVQAFLRNCPRIETLKADWVGPRSSPVSPSNRSRPRPRPSIQPQHQPGEPLVSYAVPAQLPCFISDPQLGAKLKHLGLTGGAWPVEALLGAIGGQMNHLVSLSLEQIHESANVINFPSQPPSFRLASLTLSRCTLSGSTLKWLVTSSKRSLRSLTLSSLRRRDKALGCLAFKDVFVEIGPSLRVLRARNFWEAMHPTELIESGLGYCTELRTLVIWRDTVTSPGVTPSGSALSLASSRPSRPSTPVPSRHPEPIMGSNAVRFGGGTARGPGVVGSTGLIGSATTSHLASVATATASSSLSQSHHVTGNSAFTCSSASASASGASGADEFILPAVVQILSQGWLTKLEVLAIPRKQVELCPTRVECQAKLLSRRVRLTDDWASSA